MLPGKKPVTAQDLPPEERRQFVRDRREYLVEQGLNTNNPLISVKVMLAEVDLMKYYPLFRDAGHDVIDVNKRKDDEEIDFLLETVERQNKIIFPVSHRVKLFKVLRYGWFKSPASTKRFITRKEVPKLALPKKDFKTRDADVDFKYLEPSRQRMVSRAS